MLITDVLGTKQYTQSDFIFSCPNSTRQVGGEWFLELSVLIVSRHSFTVNSTVSWHHPRPSFWQTWLKPLLNCVLATELCACSVWHGPLPCSEQSTTSAQANKLPQAVKLSGPPPLFVCCHKGPDADYRCTWHQPSISCMTQPCLMALLLHSSTLNSNTVLQVSPDYCKEASSLTTVCPCYPQFVLEVGYSFYIFIPSQPFWAE